MTFYSEEINFSVLSSGLFLNDFKSSLAFLHCQFIVSLADIYTNTDIFAIWAVDDLSM